MPLKFGVVREFAKFRSGTDKVELSINDDRASAADQSFGRLHRRVFLGPVFNRDQFIEMRSGQWKVTSR